MYLEAPVHFSLGAFPSLQMLVKLGHFCKGFVLGTPCCWSVPIIDPPETSEVSRKAHEGIFRWLIWFLPRAGMKIKPAWGTLLCSTSCSGSGFDGFLAPDWYVVLGPTPAIDVLSELGPFSVADSGIEWPVPCWAILTPHSGE